MPVKLNSSGGGSITLDVPPMTTANTLTLPAKTGNIITSGDSGTVSLGMLSPGVAGRVLLASLTASNSATLDFTSCITSAYDRYQIEFVSMVVATNGATLGIQVSTNNGSSYDAGANYLWSYTQNLVGVGTTANGGAASASRIQIFQGLLNTATPNLSATIDLYDPLNASMKKQFTGSGQAIASGDSSLYGFQCYGYYNVAAAVNAIRIAASSGNITSGTVRIYGINNNVATGPILAAGPAFSAYNSIATSLSNAVITKLQNSNVEYDTTNSYDASTNYRYTPTVAGYYLVTGQFATLGSTDVMTIQIYKNGSVFKTGTQVPNNIAYCAANISAIVYLNGTTDYIELYGYQNSGSTRAAYAAGQPNYGYFQAAFIRAA